MLILVGITLQITIGENGIVTKAKEARLAQEKESKKEEVSLAIAAWMAEKEGSIDGIEQADLDNIVGKLDPTDTMGITASQITPFSADIKYPAEHTSINKNIIVTIVIIDGNLKVTGVEVGELIPLQYGQTYDLKINPNPPKARDIGLNEEELMYVNFNENCVLGIMENQSAYIRIQTGEFGDGRYFTQNASTPPSNPSEGDLYSTNSGSPYTLYEYTSGSWVENTTNKNLSDEATTDPIDTLYFSIASGRLYIKTGSLQDACKCYISLSEMNCTYFYVESESGYWFFFETTDGYEGPGWYESDYNENTVTHIEASELPILQDIAITNIVTNNGTVGETEFEDFKQLIAHYLQPVT